MRDPLITRSRSLSRVVTAGALLATLVAGGCTAHDSPSGGTGHGAAGTATRTVYSHPSADVPSTDTTTTDTTPADDPGGDTTVLDLVDAGPSDVQCPNGELDGCFTSEDQMVDYLKMTIPMVEKYLTDTYEDIGLPDHIYVLRHGQSTEEGCETDDGYATADDESYEYCPRDNDVYIGLDDVWEFYQDYGAVSPIVGIAHEFGHYIQSQTGAMSQESIPLEDQADCVAGAWTRYEAGRGVVEADVDLPNLARFLPSLGDDEGPNQTHGTADERVAAFQVGLGGTITACNSFTAGDTEVDAPIIH